MLKIRMQRTGRTNMPAFRVIVTEHTEGPKTGNVVEQLGTYNPKTKERVLNGERITYWLSHGAKASGTVHNMLVSAGVIEGTKINVLPRKNVAQKGTEQTQTDAEAPTPEEGGDPTPPAEDVGEGKSAEESPEERKEEALASAEPAAEAAGEQAGEQKV